MKQDEQPELYEARFSGLSDHTVRVVGTLEQVVQELKKTLWWRSDKWALADLTRVGSVHIARSAPNPLTPAQVPTYTTWTASWL